MNRCLCIRGVFKQNFEYCFNYSVFKGLQHYPDMSFEMVDNLNQIKDFTNITSILFIDLPENILKFEKKVLEAKKRNVKIISMFYDPFRYNAIDECISKNLIDALLVTDEQIQKKYSSKIETLFHDYFINPNLFLFDETSKNLKDVGYCGHFLHNRSLPKNKNFTMYRGLKYKDLYQKINKEVNGMFVFDTGIMFDRKTIIHHNKAKAVESLLCGVNAYCQRGIRTKRYDKYLKYVNKDNSFSIVPVEFDIKEIIDLNYLTINEVGEFIKNIGDSQ